MTEDTLRSRRSGSHAAAAPGAGAAAAALDALKLLALLAMTLDHVNAALFAGRYDALMLIGRIAFPVFVFAAATGALRTRSPGRYLRRLLVCAIVSQPFFWYAMPVPWWYLNTVFTLFFGVAAVLAWRQGYGYLSPLLLLPAVLADYSLPGAAVIPAAALLLTAAIPLRAAAAVFYAVAGLYFWPDAEQLLIGMGASAAVLVLLVSVRRPRPAGPRYTFYVFYPLHLIILAVLQLLL